MVERSRDRIGTAKLRFVAPRNAVHLQQRADRAARHAQRRFGQKLEACLPNEVGYLVIDRLDCAPVTVAGTDPVDALASAIATAIDSARAGSGVWRFETEAAYVAAFVAAFDEGRPPLGPQWLGLRRAVNGGPAAALLSLCAERGLAPPDVLASAPMRGSALRVLSAASPGDLRDLVRLSTAGQLATASGAEALETAVLTILTAAGLAKPDRSAVVNAILAAPLDWSDPASLSDAVARGVFASGWPLGGNATRATTDAASVAIGPVPPRIAAAIDRFAWLDRSRLKQALATAALPSVSPPLRRAIAMLDRAFAELSNDVNGLPPDALRLLWHAALARHEPDHTANPVILDLIGRVTTGAHDPSPTSVSALRQRWRTLRTRLATKTLQGRPISIPATGKNGSVDTRSRPANSPATAAETCDSVQDQSARPFVRQIDSQAAGLFLLWRTLVDLNFRASALAVSDQTEFPNRALWTLFRDETGADDDGGALHFAGLPEATDPPAPITPDEAGHLAANLTGAPALRLSGRSGLGLADTLLTAFAYWLRGYETSSPDFVRKTFLARNGTLLLGAAQLEVRLEPRPFDLVLRRAGYLAPFSAPEWLGGARTHFSLGKAP